MTKRFDNLDAQIMNLVEEFSDLKSENEEKQEQIEVLKKELTNLNEKLETVMEYIQNSHETQSNLYVDLLSKSFASSHALIDKQVIDKEEFEMIEEAYSSKFKEREHV